MTEPQVISEPTILPISLIEIKQRLKLDDLSDPGEQLEYDAELTLLIGAARKYYEWRTSRTIHQTTLLWAVSQWPGCGYIELPRATPLISVTSVTYYDQDGAATTLDAANYIEDTFSQPGRLVLKHGGSWPTASLYPVAPIRIEYEAGIERSSPTANTPEADPDIKIPIALIVGGLLANPEADVITNMTSIKEISLQYGAESFIERRIAKYAF